MKISSFEIMSGTVECKVYNDDALELINDISGDILYLDPPYNERQYCTNYHLLETIARNDNPTIKGKTGLRNYENQKSIFCNKNEVERALDTLIYKAKFKYIFLSYNNEGLLTIKDIKNIMHKYGKYSFYRKKYKRFKSDKSNANKEYTTEYLHCLVKEGE